MMLLNGFVLLKELYSKANVSNSLFGQLNGVVIEKIGSDCIVKTDSLPEKYKKIALECSDLGGYYFYTQFSRELGMCNDWMHVVEYHRKKKFDGIIVGKKKLLKLSDEFVDYVKQGYTPFKITPTSKEFAEHKIVMQGIEIGFY